MHFKIILNNHENITPNSGNPRDSQSLSQQISPGVKEAYVSTFPNLASFTPPSP